MIWALWLGCSPAPAPPTLAVEARWPGHAVEAVDATLATHLSSALAPVASHVRCESVDDALRCLVEGAGPGAIDQALVRSELERPAGVEGLVVRPLPPLPEAPRWLVLDPVPLAWTWQPQVAVLARWPLPRVEAGGLPLQGTPLVPDAQVTCDGVPATALWVDRLPQEAPPAGVAVRTWSPEAAVHLEGPAASVEAVRAALEGLPHCLALGDDRVLAVVDAAPGPLAAQLVGVDVVPPQARARRWRLDRVDPATVASLHALDGVWAVRTVGPAERPRVEWSIDPARVAAAGLTVEAVSAALQPGTVEVGAFTLPTPPPATLEGPDGPVPLTAVASRTEQPVPALRVRIDGAPGALLEVLVADEAAAARVDAVLDRPALEPWALRTHRP